MDILEDLEKPIMNKLMDLCPDIDMFEKLKTLKLTSSYTSRGKSFGAPDALKDVWVGCIKMPIPGRHRITNQPVVWLKFQENKLDIGVVDTPAETYEYADPNKFTVESIAEIVNKVTKTYRAHRR